MYGTPEAAIKTGPTYGSKVKIDLGTKMGQSWNNVSYRIPQVNEYFTLNDGWTIDYVSVAGNSSGKRQPGTSFLLGMSGGSMVYYFKKTAPSTVTYTLSYDASSGYNAPTAQIGKSATGSYKFTISTQRPMRDGYVFKGWSTSSDANRVDYEPDDTIIMDGSKTLYAVWERTPVTANYTVKWIDENSKPIKADETRSGNIGKTVSANDHDKRVLDYTYERSKSIESAVLKNGGTVLILCFTKNKPNLNIMKTQIRRPLK
ncbi:hypothetical protein D3Z38_18645 [Clostridiales bacterium]|nr:hypothetical protein [Clostridiales bacterium]